MENIIEIKNLSKSFGELKAVDDISFCVKKGELFAFLGVNGAGKSTTINMLCNQLGRDSGLILINGNDPDKNPDAVKRSIGVVFQESVLDRELTVKDNLESRAALYGITGSAFKKRLLELSEILEFKNLLKRPVGKLSGGQRRRIDVAKALLHSPEILILDEPTTGLDPQTRSLLWAVVERLRKEENMTVFLTTHYMEETTDADYIVILDSGRISAQGTPLELKNKYTGDFVTVYGISADDAAKLSDKFVEVKSGYRISLPDTAAATRLILKHPDIFCDYEVTKGNMDDVFLAVTGKKLVGGDIQ